MGVRRPSRASAGLGPRTGGVKSEGPSGPVGRAGTAPARLSLHPGLGAGCGKWAIQHVGPESVTTGRGHAAWGPCSCGRQVAEGSLRGRASGWQNQSTQGLASEGAPDISGMLPRRGSPPYQGSHMSVNLHTSNCRKDCVAKDLALVLGDCGSSDDSCHYAYCYHCHHRVGELGKLKPLAEEGPLRLISELFLKLFKTLGFLWMSRAILRLGARRCIK